MPRPLAPLVVPLALLLAAPATGLAQDASPAASPPAAVCDAPELPPGTPTPMEEMAPGGEAEATPGVAEEQAEVAVAEEATPEPLAGTPVSGAEAEAAVSAVENLFACINAGDYLAAAALMTDDFIQGFLEVPTPYDVPATFEDVQPVELRSVGAVETYADGRVGVETVYSGLFLGPGAIGGARWTFAEEDGVLKLDTYEDINLPQGVLPEATVIDVQMVDFAFALDTYTIPSGPVVFRTTNASGDNPHVNVMVTLTEGTTAEEVISGEANVDEVFTGFYGAVFLEPGQTADLAFEDLAPGTYFLVCDVETEDGTPHFELGMVSEITVE